MKTNNVSKELAELHDAIWLLLNYLDGNCEDLDGYYEATGLLMDILEENGLSNFYA